jgi:hypothetical protein
MKYYEALQRDVQEQEAGAILLVTHTFGAAGAFTRSWRGQRLLRGSVSPGV